MSPYDFLRGEFRNNASCRVHLNRTGRIFILLVLLLAQGGGSTISLVAADEVTFNAPLTAAAADAITYIGDIGTATSKTSGTSLAINPSSAVAAGDDIVITYATDPLQTYEIRVTDTAGNTYYQVAASTNTGNLRTYIFAAYDVNALTTSDTITIAHSSITARAAVVSVFRGLAPGGALDQNHIGYANLTTTPSSGSITTTQADELLIGAIGTEGPSEDTAGTWGSGWNAGQRVGTTGGTVDTNITVSMGYQIVSSTGTYEASKSGITSRDAAAVIASFKTTCTGICYIGDIGYAQSTTSGGSLTVTTRAGVAAGDDIIVTFAMDANAGTVSVADEATNTYTSALADVTNSGSVRTLIFAAYNVSALPSDSDITITHPTATTARSAVVSVYRGLADSDVLDQTQTGTGSSTSPSSGTTGTTSQADELLIGAVGTEGPNQDTIGIWGNAFNTADRRGGNTGSADANITVALGWRIVASTGTYAASISGITSRDWAAAIATFKGGPSGPTQDLTIAVSPEGGGTTDPAEGVHTYPQNDVVTITATPNVGYVFSGWTGDVADPGSATTTVTMDADKTVTANFTATNYELTMAVDPSGGGTTSPAVGGPYSYGAGAVVDITATANVGYVFSHWTGDGVADVNAASTTVTMDATKTVTAHFTVIPTYDLTMAVDPAGGGSTDPAVGTHTYDENTVVDISATANTGYLFDHWTGDGVADVNAASTTVTMDATKTVTAHFAEGTTITLDGAVSSGTADGVSSINISHTTGTGTDRLMLVGVSANSYNGARTISSVTFSYGTTELPLTEVGSVENEAGRLAAIYGLVNPPSGQAGTVTVTFSGSVAYGIVAGAANFAGVDQTTPLDTFVSAVGTEATAISVDVTTDAKDLVFGTVFLGAATVPALTVGASQTEQWNTSVDRARGAASTEQATGASVTMSWTASGGSTAYYWAIGAVPINPAPVGPTTGTIIVEKQTDPDGWTDKDFDFTGDASGSIGDGEQIIVPDLQPGTYHSQETVPAGWILTDIVCDDDNSEGDLPNFEADFQLEAGETVKCTFYNLLEIDYGDAPDTYKTLLASNGARHVIIAGHSLGPIVDAEPDGQPSPLADGDDLNPAGGPDDEDGVTLPALLTAGDPAASVTVDGGPSGGMLDAWVDFDGSGVFDHPSEHLWAGASQTLLSGPNLLTFAVPAGALPGQTYARFRLSMAGNLPPDGLAPDGEVEDYLVEIGPQTFTLNYAAGAGGSLTGDTSQVVAYGGDGTAVTAVPDTGYHFVDWSDGSTANPRTDANVTANVNVTASFALDTFTLNYAAGAGGSLTGDTSQEVAYGGDGTAVTAVPDTGYHFVDWSDGSTANPRTDTNVTANVDVTASFALDTFTLNYAAGAGGSLTGDTSQVVAYGGDGTAVTAVPDTGYHFVDWSDGSTANPRTDANVTANVNVTASFALDTFTLNYAAGAGGSLTGDTSQEVAYGGDGTAVTAVPDTGYHFVDWSDGSTANPRTDTNVTANVDVTANFARILGDVNGDDAVNSTDALIVLSCDAGLDTSQFCPMNCGDVNDDGVVNSTDALIILSYDAEMTVPFPVGEPGCPASVTPCGGCSAGPTSLSTGFRPLSPDFWREY